jgi:NADH-quinone oxidoreductase subunit H
MPLADTQFVEATGVWIIKSLVIFGFIFAVVPLLTLLERKLIGRFQNRYGPNRVGPFGILQPLADVIKLISKEQSHPRTAAPLLMALAPAISIVTAVASLAIIPFGNVKEGFGTKYGLYGIDVNIGVLYAFAFGSLAFYGVMLGGWASGSKYSFLGAMRSAAQLISYEVSLALAVIGVVMMAGSLSLVDIVKAQHSIWYVLPQFVGLLVFTVTGLAELNRAPFDLPEADAELVAGYNTEFAGMRLGSYLLSEYLNMIVIAGLAAALFLGGWRGPGPGYLDPLWMILKMLLFVWFFIWVRATLPRFRYDQLMSFGWKVLLPVATLNLLVTAILVTVL